ncbi:MAG TPA: hypothetical protein VG347_21110 [Verrucomicrobiae bacterium]|nr:hypothetical protein [Verrucomicrobiae bacterium]
MSDDWRSDPATDKQKEKLGFFGCSWDEGITKGQASDAIGECVIQFPETQQKWLARPATPEQLEELQSYGEEPEASLTYGEAKELLHDPDAYHSAHPPQSAINVAPAPTHTKRGFFGWISDKLEQRKARIAEAKAQRKTYIDNIISSLRNGQSPGIDRPIFLLQRGEIICWAEPSTLEEVKVVGRHYEGSSSGVSFRLAKGVRFTVGRQRGHAVSETAAVTTSTGELIITNKRLAFLGDNKSIALKFEKILDIHPASNGIKFSDGGKSGPKLIRYNSNRNADIICEVLNYVLGY